MRSCCEKICGGEKMKNQEIRNEISKRRLRHFEVAEACGVSTYTFSHMMGVAERQQNRIAKKSLKDTIELLILVELDRAEQEREITVKRIKDGIAASDKKSGRKTGQLDKMTPELQEDIKKFLSDRSIKQIDLMNKYHISRNTLKKYIGYIANENCI